MFAVDRMSWWRRCLTGGMLAAIVVLLLEPQVARADPGVSVPVPSGVLSEFGDSNLSEQDRDFLIRVRLAGFFPEFSDSNLSEQDRDFLIRVRLAGLGA